MIPKHALQLIEAINTKKLSKAESGFISSVSIQAKQDRRLTDKQSKYLQDLYTKSVGGGQYANREYIR